MTDDTPFPVIVAATFLGCCAMVIIAVAVLIDHLIPRRVAWDLDAVLPLHPSTEWSGLS